MTTWYVIILSYKEMKQPSFSKLRKIDNEKNDNGSLQKVSLAYNKTIA